MQNIDIFTAIRVRRPLRAVFFAVGVAGALTAAAGIAAADSSDDAPQRVVRFSAESLRTDDGARAVYASLVRAAEQVCPSSSSDRPFVRSVVLECRAHAIANAVQQINNVHLAAVAASSKRG